MRILIDFLPILAFFVAYKLANFQVATITIMVATVVQMAVIYKWDGRLQTLHKVTLALVLGFGALTVLLNNNAYLQWKPTVLYVLIAVGLWLYSIITRKNPLAAMLGKQLDLPSHAWHKLLWSWILYALFMAAINAYVVLYYTEAQWVDFKLWGYIFPLLFFVGQGIYIAKVMKDKP